MEDDGEKLSIEGGRGTLTAEAGESYQFWRNEKFITLVSISLSSEFVELSGNDEMAKFAILIAKNTAQEQTGWW